MAMEQSRKVTTRLPDRVVAYIDDTALCDGLARLADGCGIAMAEVLPGGLAAALADDAPAAEVILLEIENPDDAVEALSVLSARSDARLLAVGRRDDVRTYRRLREAGASDYLVAPLDDDDLLTALRVPAGRPARETSDTPHLTPRVTVFLGCRGGVGTTSLAVSCAWWAAEKLKTQTALVDLDLVFGTATLALDLLPGRGLREALEHPERIDPLFVGSAMINATDNLFVLGAEEHPGLETMPVPDGPVRLIEAVAESVPTIMVDLPRAMLPASRDLIRRADEVVLVTDLSLGGLRDSIRLRTLCRECAPDTALTLVGIVPATGAPPIERREFERACECAVDWLVPLDGKAAAEAASAGKPVAARLKPKHAYSRAVRNIAERAVPAAPTDGIHTGKAKRKWLW
ncbi:AAA family ATPase [Pacificispira sp.]|uniref:AAA family ATPase n=1 Tax=Pacificispira sp. TaxID=2888761 RepID=UPI003BAC1F06